MEDLRETYYDCPECENENLKESAKECPQCGTKLKFCDEGHLADASDFDEELDICKECWQSKIDKD